MKQCIYCGAELPEEARACSNCGRPLPEELQPKEEVKPSEQARSETPSGINDSVLQAQINPASSGDGNTASSGWSAQQAENTESTVGWNPQQQGTMGSAPGWNMLPQTSQEQTLSTEFPVRKTHTLAIVSLCLSIVSIFLNAFLFLPSILALVFGIVALIQIKKEPERYTGGWMAILGMIIGGVTLVVYAVIFGIVFQRVWDAFQDPDTLQQVQEYLHLSPGRWV